MTGCLKSHLLGLVFVSIFLSTLLAQADEVRSPRTLFSLDGTGWKLVGLRPGEGEKLQLYLPSLNKVHLIPTTVPSDVQTCIGLSDPYGQGPEIVAINKKEWWYLRSFSSPRVGPGRQVRLVFDGVDYFADVWLNGIKLGSHEGAYTRFWFDVTERIQPRGENYLAIRVTSPWKVPERSHYEFMKGEFEETWDALPGPGQVVFPLGLHRSVRLEITAATRLEELQIWTSSLEGDRAELKSRVVISNLGGSKQGTLQLAIKPESFSGPTLSLPAQPFSFSGQPGERQEIEFSAEIDHPQLWWTWDQGPQNLYTVEAAFWDSQGAVLDRTSSVFGIRTLERDSNLLYKLNGRPIFLRGAWYSMSKLYPADTDPWTYEKDLRLARHANMNHLVNYTVVEKEDFYNLADRLGILLFIELPFNQEGPIDALNAHYPRRDEFIRWSSQEVTQIVRTLANHPSVGVWSAVSEVTGNGKDFTTAGDPRIVEAADGYEMFVKKMEDVVTANDPDALYFRSYCDFGEHHFWEGAFFAGTTYDQQFDAQAQFVSEYGALAFFPFEDIRRIVKPDELWDQAGSGWSSLAIPVKMKRMSYLHGWQYFGMDFLTADIAANVDRHLRSFRDYVADSQVYQAFLYGYAADAYRRKIFAPINGIRSWMFKSFPEKPVSGFGVIDCFDTPTMGYYAQKRTFAPVSMSFAARYALESIPAGSPWNVPVWISNATNDAVSLSVQTTLYSLKGDTLRSYGTEVSVGARQAQRVFALKWNLPKEPGIYLLRGRANRGMDEVAAAEMYVKVVPRATRRTLRVLVVGTPEWAQPVADYLSNLGAAVTPVIKEPTVVREPENPFPDSAQKLLYEFDVIWLTGFDNYWREAPDRWTETIVRAIESGVTFVHTGSWSSFHGGNSDRTAALDLTPLAPLLPVEVGHENDVFPKTTYRVGSEVNDTPPRPPSYRIAVSASAPRWLKDVDFAGLTPASYHLLTARPSSTVLLEMDGMPILVVGHSGEGQTIAYTGFSPEGSAKLGEHTTILDRAIRESAENRLFAIISASVLTLASGEDPRVPVKELVETRATPLYETLKNTPHGAWPEVSLSWDRAEGRTQARIQIRNGSRYLRGFRMRFDGPDFRTGRALTLWSDQFFDLLPGEETECNVELLTADHKPLQAMSLAGETIYGADSKTYPIPYPPSW